MSNKATTQDSEKTDALVRLRGQNRDVVVPEGNIMYAEAISDILIEVHLLDETTVLLACSLDDFAKGWAGE